MLTRVTLLCFADSYAVALLLESVRVFTQIKLRLVWLWGWTLAGMVAHSAYLVMRANDGITSRGAPLSNWYHWCLIAAWCMALVYLLWSLSRPGTSIGLFLLPLTLGLIGLARTFPSNQSFPVDQATRVWGTIHGIGLMLGTVSVLLGFATGIMYLLQSRRLKQKRLNHRIKLPSLEWLGRANERCLIWSSFFLTGGLLAGIVLNMTTQQNTTSMIPWTDPGIFVSAILQLWLVAATIFSFVYKPARMGRKVAYLTVANFVILALTLSMVLFGPSDHTRTTATQAAVEAIVDSMPRDLDGSRS
jgi:hypothetical protein